MDVEAPSVYRMDSRCRSRVRIVVMNVDVPVDDLYLGYCLDILLRNDMAVA